MNCVSLIGRLVRDPELRYAQNGTAICRFTIAVDRRMSKQKRQEAQANNQQTADFIGSSQGQNQGGFNQNQGGFNQNNFQSQNQGGFNQGGFNQGGFNNDQPVNSAYGNDFSKNDNDDEDGFFPVDNDDIPF